MFALGGHGEEIANAMDFARLWAPCQLRFHWFQDANLW
jgi:hypothetical protein